MGILGRHKSICAVIVAAISLLVGEYYVFTSLSTNRDLKFKVFRFHWIVLVETFMLFCFRYIWKNLVTANENLFSTQKLSVIWKLTLLLFFGCCQFSYLSTYLLTGTDPHWFSVVCFVCFGTLLQFVFWFFLLNGLVMRLLCKRRDQVACPKLRQLIALVISLSLVGKGLYTTSQLPEVRHVEVPVHNLPMSLDGFRIIQLSDIHLGPTVGREMLERVVQLTNTLHGDLVVITGDLVDSSVHNLRYAAEPLKALKSAHGTFFITGNHEYYSGGVDEWFSYLKSLGISVLHNQHTTVQHPNHPQDFFYLAGVDDITPNKIGYANHGMDLKKAVASCDQKHPIILLAHQPKGAKEALDSVYNISLVLSGHTHGGQMFPFSLGAYLMNPFYLGLYKYNERSYVYVSEGTFYWGVPLRIFTSMEIAHITLKAA